MKRPLLLISASLLAAGLAFLITPRSSSVSRSFSPSTPVPRAISRPAATDSAATRSFAAAATDLSTPRPTAKPPPSTQFFYSNDATGRRVLVIPDTVSLPVALAPEALQPRLPQNTPQAETFYRDRLTQISGEFTAAFTGSSPDALPTVKQWREAVEQADEQMRSLLGTEEFQRLSLEATKSSLLESAAPAP